MNWYYIHANIDGAKRWHIVYDRQPGLYFVQSDFEEEHYDIEEYRREFPDNEVVEIPSVHEIKQPLGICDDHARVWGLFLYDRLRLTLEVVGEALVLLSKMPDTGSVDGDEEEDETNRGQVCIMLERLLDYAEIDGQGVCGCDEVGEGRCPRHGWENLMAGLRLAKKGKGA